MNLQEKTNEQLVNNLVCEIFISKDSPILKDIVNEIKSRLCAPKQPYQIKYKFLTNDRDIDDMKALTVWGTSPLAACQTLVDANDWRGQSMEFQVNEYHFTLDDLE